MPKLECSYVHMVGGMSFSYVVLGRFVIFTLVLVLLALTACLAVFSLYKYAHVVYH